MAGKTPPTILTYFYSDVMGTEVPELPTSAFAPAPAPAQAHAAVQWPSEPAAHAQEAPRITLDLFCDGACVNNGRRGARAAFGLVVYRAGVEIAAAAERLEAHETQTNQRAELRGLFAAVQYATKSVEAGATTVRIYSDSEYAINCVTRWAPGWARSGWRKADKDPVLHADLIAPLYEMWKALRGVAFLQHVAAHTGRSDPLSLGNARADELATSALSR